MRKRSIEFYEQALNIVDKEISATLKRAQHKIHSVFEKELKSLYLKNKQQPKAEKHAKHSHKK